MLLHIELNLVARLWSLKGAQAGDIKEVPPFLCVKMKKSISMTVSEGKRRSKGGGEVEPRKIDGSRARTYEDGKKMY